ncbi:MULTISPECIES: DUF4352 domain-containing protein [Nocardia]|uniref:DUF4352 domain-containing protein n=1 Tax=Nocardia TaxID=1817 RepID=UPI001E5020B5|nr:MULTISPECIES: DUF4352 domain-containing protein [Nocardia]
MTYPQQPPTGPQQQPYGTQPGYPIQQPHPSGYPGQQYPVQQTPKKKTPVWPFLLILLPILLCGGCFGIVSLASNSDTDETSTSNRNGDIAAIGSAVRDGKFEFQVTSVEAPVSTLGSGYREATAMGEFIVIRLDVTNTGNEPRSYIDSNQKLFDAQGREFANDSSAVRAVNSEDWKPDLNPGFKIQVALVFDVPIGTVPTSLELHDSMFSGGTKVALR